jgi:YidC/Oxa1 family membrane protein insertase
MLNIWNTFVTFLQNILLTFYHATGNAGVAIILFTVVARLIILPLTLKSLQSTRKMQELQPQIKELQRTYGKDPQKLQQETMKLYREYKVNPAGGCLPMILQFPIFIGVYQAVIGLTPSSVAGHVVQTLINVMTKNGLPVANLADQLTQHTLGGGFLWLTDLGKVDPYYILPVLSVIFQLIVQLMAMPRVQDAQQKMMSQSMLVLPLMFGYIGFTFPSGAVLYWVVGSILSMIQQYVISGWGSLANYLKFLPPDRGLFPPATPSTALAAASASSNGSTLSAAEPAQKVGFWDVLRPLMEREPVVEEQTESDSATEQALSDARRQANQSNPRRRKARR